MNGLDLLPDPLHLQVQKEALHDGVVAKPQACPAVAFAAHAANQAVFSRAVDAQRCRIAFPGLKE